MTKPPLTQPGTETPRQYTGKKRRQGWNLAESRAKAKQIQEDRKRTWSERAYEPSRSLPE